MLGHQIVATVEGTGATGRRALARLDRRRLPLLPLGPENLATGARFTGYDIDGGFAEYAVADERFCFPIPEGFTDAQAAPLLCAGLIGYRALRLCGDARRLGLYGFGAAAHILAQVAAHQGREVFAFTRPATRRPRRSRASWAPCGRAARPGRRPSRSTPRSSSRRSARSCRPRCGPSTAAGVVVCGGIHMSDIPSFPYELLWEERVLRSVANLTRRDGEEFLALAPQVPVRARVTSFPLEAANEALGALREGRFTARR